MATKKAAAAAAPVNLRMRPEVRLLIDRAARLRGKNRTEFIVEASLAAAEQTLLDQTLVQVSLADFEEAMAVLDAPPGGEGFARLMSAPKPWDD